MTKARFSSLWMAGAARAVAARIATEVRAVNLIVSRWIMMIDRVGVLLLLSDLLDD